MKPGESEEEYSWIPSSDSGLLDECEVHTYRSHGPGGQNVDRRETAVRLHHLPTGIVVQCQTERSQLVNKRLALAQLREELKGLLRPPTRRIAAARPRRAGVANRDFKERRATKKALRKRPDLEQ